MAKSGLACSSTSTTQDVLQTWRNENSLNPRQVHHGAAQGRLYLVMRSLKCRNSKRQAKQQESAFHHRVRHEYPLLHTVRTPPWQLLVCWLTQPGRVGALYRIPIEILTTDTWYPGQDIPNRLLEACDELRHVGIVGLAVCRMSWNPHVMEPAWCRTTVVSCSCWISGCNTLHTRTLTGRCVLLAVLLLT